MNPNIFRNIEKIESNLWEAADQLRANSKLTSSDYFMPVLGIIFLRHAANRFETATMQIREEQASGKMPKRKVMPADYIRRRALWLPEIARYDATMKKASSERRNHVLMIDARNIYRVVNRKILDFSPEQMQNLSAMVWLYRGQKNRFLDLVKRYIGSVCSECESVPEKLDAFEATLKSLRDSLYSMAKKIADAKDLDAEKNKSLAETMAELHEAIKPYEIDRARLLREFDSFRKDTGKTPPSTDDKQHITRKTFDPIADRGKGLIKQINLLYKLASRAVDTAADLPLPSGSSCPTFFTGHGGNNSLTYTRDHQWANIHAGTYRTNSKIHS